MLINQLVILYLLVIPMSLNEKYIDNIYLEDKTIDKLSVIDNKYAYYNKIDLMWFVDLSTNHIYEDFKTLIVVFHSLDDYTLIYKKNIGRWRICQQG